MRLPKHNLFRKSTDLHSALRSMFISVSVVLLLASGVIVVVSENLEYTQQTNITNESYIKFNKQSLQNEVDRVLAKVEEADRTIEIQIKQEIKSSTELLKANLYSIYNSNKGQLPKRQLQQLLIEVIKSHQLYNSEVSYFIADAKGNCILDKDFKEKEGSNISNELDDLGSHWFINASMAVDMSDKVFVSAYWKRESTVNNLADRRVLFLTRFEPFNWVLGESIFYNTYLEKRKQRLMTEIANVSFLETGRFFVSNFEGQLLLSQGEIQSLKKSNADAKYGSWDIYSSVTEVLSHKKSGFLFRNWPVISDEASQIVYVSSYVNWDWVIGAELNMDRIHEQILQNDRKAFRSSLFRLLLGLLLIFIMLAVGSYVSRRFTSKVIAQLQLFLNYFNGSNDNFIDPQKLQYTEFKSLADAANTLLAEKKQALSLANRERIYSARLFHNIPLAIAIIDKSLTITRTNIEFERLFGGTRDEFRNEHISIITPKDKQKEESELFKKTLLGESFDLKVTKRVCKETGPIDVSLLAMPVFRDDTYFATYLVYHNITDRLAAQRKLVENQNLLSVFFENSLEGFLIFQFDKPLSGRDINSLSSTDLGLLKTIKLINYNKAFGQLCNHNTNDITGFSIDQVFPGHELFLLKHFFSLLKKGSSQMYSYSIDQNNCLVWFEGKYICYYDDDGNVKGFFGVQNNISKRRTIERNLKRAKNKAEQADKLKTAFLSNMSHEIRTPMNSIIGFSDLLLDSTISPAETADFVKDINESSKTLLKLIEDIIDIAKIESNQLRVRHSNTELFPIFNKLQKTSLLQQQQIGKEQLKLEMLIPTTNISIYTDPLRLKQVFWNLISNALKFTDNGVVQFGYQYIENETKRYCHFFVKDSGIGISDKNQKLVFDRFVKLETNEDEEISGAGLGLSISKKLVELMGSQLIMHSEIGKGSSFSFELPVGTFQNEKKRENVTALFVEEQKRTTDEIFNFKGSSILVAEDNSINYRLIEKVLAKTQVSLIHAKNGLEVIEFIDEGVSIDLFLMDIQMPKMNGISCTEIIRSRNMTQAIIAQTAFTMNSEDEKLLEIGFTEIINKPINAKKLLKLLQKYLS